MNKLTLFCALTLILFLACTISIEQKDEIKNTYSLSIDSVQLKRDVSFLSMIEPARNYKNPQVLDSIADYVLSTLKPYADTVYYQIFTVNGVEYKNVIAKYGLKFNKKVIIGAHYDVCHDLPGADDNASGVAGLLEIGRNINVKHLNHQIELVAYSLEEPPFFRTNQMGSAVHSASVKPSNVIGMICLEMIGYYSEKPNTQDYPIAEMKYKYPTTGNFIAVIGNLKQASFAKSISDAMEEKCQINIVAFNGPSTMKGIDFSDHLNYWNHNINAVMITNTAFYRNKNYHTKLDVKEALNYSYMTWVVEGVLNAACKINE